MVCIMHAKLIVLCSGDQLLRKDMSEAQREQLTAILEDIYEGFTQGIAQSRGKTTQEVCIPCIPMLF